MEGGDNVKIAVVDMARISLGREVQPEASDFSKVARELFYILDGEMQTSWQLIYSRVPRTYAIFLTKSKIAQVAEELCSAFQETGFAYLVNHGIGPDLIEEVYCSLKPKQSMWLQNLHQAMEKSFEFFSLDEDLKEKLRKGPEYQVGQYCLLFPA